MATPKNETQEHVIIIILCTLILCVLYKSPISILPSIIFIILAHITGRKIVIYIASVIVFSYSIYMSTDNTYVLQKIFTFYDENFSFKHLLNKTRFSGIVFFIRENSFTVICDYFISVLIIYSLPLYVLSEVMVMLLMKEDASKKLMKPKRKEVKKVNISKVSHSKEHFYVPLGVNLWTNGKNPVGIPHSLLNRHVCLVGTTGSGKTVTLYNFILNALLFNKAIIFVDGKGDLHNVQKFREVCRRFNRSCRVITLDGSAGYNPFATGTPTELTDKIISMFDWSEEHYKLSAARFIQLLIRYMQLSGISCNLPNIIKYSSVGTLTAYHLQYCDDSTAEGRELPDDELPNFDMPDEAGPLVESSQVDVVSEEASEILEKIRGIDPKAIQGMQARIAVLAEGDMSQMFSAPQSLDLSNAIEGGEAVLFSLDSLRYPQQSKALGRLVTNDLKACVSRHARNGSTPVGLFFDEFNVFASHEVVDIVNKSRSAGFEAVLSFQSLSDIDKLESGEALRRQIIQNCNCLIVQLQNDAKDAEELAALFGTEAAVEATVQTNEGSATGMQSMRRVHEFIVHPDEIKRLGVGQAFAKIPGLEPTKVQILPN